jgi:PAS domain S-box-containing protein
MVAKVDTEEVLAVWHFESAGIMALTLLLVLAAVAAVVLVWQRNDKAHYQSLARGQAALCEEKEKLAVTLRSIGDGVIATDADGVVTVLNNVAADLTGWSPDEAVGQPFETVFNAVNETTREPISNLVRRVLETGKPVEMANDTVLVSRTGEEKLVEDSCAPILGDEGSVAGVMLVFRDVTERKQAEAALRESEERHRVIFEGSAQCILIADGKTRQFI